MPTRVTIHAALLALAAAAPVAGAAQATAPVSDVRTATAPVADVLQATLVDGSAAAGRASLRVRTERTAAGTVEVIASGIVVRGRRRVQGELRTDTLLALRRYVAETRDSAGAVADRVELTAAGGRLLLVRTVGAHRMTRELPAPAGGALLLRDDDALVPLLVAAARPPARGDSVTVLDVRTGVRVAGVATAEPPRPLTIAEATLDAVPVIVRAGGVVLLSWWRDARGRLLLVPVDGAAALRRDDPPG